MSQESRFAKGPDLFVAKNRVMVVRNISQAKAELSALLAEVARGNEVIIAKAGKPVARLVAYQRPARPPKPSSMAGEIWIAPDFDALPQDMADAFGMTAPGNEAGS